MSYLKVFAYLSFQFLPLYFRETSPNLEIAPHLFARQATATQGCPISGGGIAGVVLGTFFGTILLIYFFSVITGPNQRAGRDEVIIEKEGTEVEYESQRQWREKTESIVFEEELMMLQYVVSAM